MKNDGERDECFKKGAADAAKDRVKRHATTMTAHRAPNERTKSSSSSKKNERSEEPTMITIASSDSGLQEKKRSVETTGVSSSQTTA